MKLFKPTKTTPEQKAYYNSTEYHTTTQLEHNILDIFSDPTTGDFKSREQLTFNQLWDVDVIEGILQEYKNETC